MHHNGVMPIFARADSKYGHTYMIIKLSRCSKLFYYIKVSRSHIKIILSTYLCQFLITNLKPDWSRSTRWANYCDTHEKVS